MAGFQSKQIRVGIIGFGQRGRKHAQMLSHIPYVKLSAVTDTDKKILEIAQNNYNVKTFSDYNDFFDYDIDCVFLCTPPTIRLHPIERALKTGKHVFCEKPIALSMEEADQIIHLANNVGRYIMVGYGLRFKQPYRVIKHMLNEGKLGELVCCWISKREYFPELRWKELTIQKHWRTFSEQGGGRFIERSHQMDWLLWVGGRARSVFGRAATIAEGITVDDLNVAILNFEKGFGNLLIAFIPNTIDEVHVGVIGKKGSITFNGAKCFMKRKNEKIQEIPLPPSVSIYEHFFESIKRGKRPDSDATSARDTLITCLALRQSSITQELVVIN